MLPGESSGEFLEFIGDAGYLGMYTYISKVQLLSNCRQVETYATYKTSIAIYGLILSTTALA